VRTPSTNNCNPHPAEAAVPVAAADSPWQGRSRNLKASTTARNSKARAQQTKEVFEMATSRFIEEESGTCPEPIRRRHNGYTPTTSHRVLSRCPICD